MFDFDSFYHDDIKTATGHWKGFPEYNFIGGHNDASMVPVDALRASADRVMTEHGQRLATYNLGDGPLGLRSLREFIGGALAVRADMPTDPDNILLVSGSLQALDLVNETLLRSGDIVIMEESTYGGVISRFQHLDVDIIGIRVGAAGMDLAHLEEQLEALKAQGKRARYIYTIPTIHNPTGTIMPTENRQRLLALASRYNVPIFEDDCYADLIFDEARPPTIRSLDDSGRVIYCGSFSKTVAPALRVGYLIADWPFLSRATSYKTDAGSGALEQLILADFCPKYFDTHVEKLNKHLQTKCDVICEALDKNFGTTAQYHRPKGGIFIWVTLDKSIDILKLTHEAAKQGVAINAGPEWSLGAEAAYQMRLCFGYPEEAEIKQGVAKLAEICQRHFGLPKQISNK